MRPAKFTKRSLSALILLVWSGTCLAGSETSITRQEDRDGDGKPDTQVFLDKEGKIHKEISDKNADGKTDKITHYKNGKPLYGEEDADYDGKTDTWHYYDDNGALVYIVMDTNKDDTPDTLKRFVKGRNLVLREYDRNFDGRIDKRALTQWDPEKKISVPDGNRMNHVLTPGYVALWSEEDNNYDGKIDAYRERGKKAADQTRVGQNINNGSAKLFGRNQRLDKKLLS